MKRIILIIIILLFVNGCSLKLGSDIKSELLLKVSKDNILDNKEVDEMHCPTIIKTDCVNVGRMVKYKYITDIEVKVEKLNGLDEDLSKRTANSLHYKKPDGSYTSKFYVGYPFYQDKDGKWYQVETATTTIEAYEEHTKLTWRERIFGEPAKATDYPVGIGDGLVVDNSTNVWATVHNKASGELAYHEYASLGCVLISSDKWYFERGAYPTDTSAITAGATINSASLHVYANASTGSFATTSAVTQTDQAQEETVEVDDFSHYGTNISGSPMGSNQVEQITMSGWTTFTFNATGLSWIKTNGDTSNCGDTTGYTCLGVIASPDIVDLDPGNTGYCVPGRDSESASDPYLTVDWTAPVTDTCTYDGAGDWLIADICYVSSNVYVKGNIYIMDGGELNCIDNAIITTFGIKAKGGQKIMAKGGCKIISANEVD